MTIEGVDYAFHPPTIASLVNGGKHFACRYGGKGSSDKWLKPNESAALIAAGIAIVANVEGQASGLLNGASEGADWAEKALAFFKTFGIPDGRPIYLSVDFDTRSVSSSQWTALDAAFDAAAKVLGRNQVGVYGGYQTIRHFYNNQKAKWYWQTYGWSGGLWHPAAHIRQYKNHVEFGGGIVDFNLAMKSDYGQWGVEDRMTEAEHKLLVDTAALVLVMAWRVRAFIDNAPNVAGGPEGPRAATATAPAYPGYPNKLHTALKDLEEAQSTLQATMDALGVTGQFNVTGSLTVSEGS